MASAHVGRVLHHISEARGSKPSTFCPSPASALQGIHTAWHGLSGGAPGLNIFTSAYLGKEPQGSGIMYILEYQVWGHSSKIWGTEHRAPWATAWGRALRCLSQVSETQGSGVRWQELGVEVVGCIFSQVLDFLLRGHSPVPGVPTALLAEGSALFPQGCDPQLVLWPFRRLSRK